MNNLSAPMATVEAGFGTTPRAPLTTFNVFGLLTFWVYTALRTAFVIRDHMSARWNEFGSQLAHDGLASDRREEWRRRGFDARIAVPVAAAVMFAVSGLMVVVGFVRWWLVSEGFLDYPVIKAVVTTAATLFYAATCMLVLWAVRTIHAHELAELALRERGGEKLGDADRIVPGEAMVVRWEQINNGMALFLIVSLAMVSAPVVAAHLYISGETSAYTGLPALVCFVLAGVFHFWGTQLLVGTFNSHLAIEAAHALRASPALGAMGNGSLAAAPAGGVESYAGAAPFVFVSYKREDIERIAPVLQTIGEWGYPLWFDKGIPGGAEWDEMIEERLRNCAVAIFFLSAGSVDSKYCRREVKFVDQLNKPILSVRLETVDLAHGLEMLLTQYQIVDLQAPDFRESLQRALAYLWQRR